MENDPFKGALGQVEFASEPPIVEGLDRKERIEIRERFVAILDGLKAKDPQVSFNTDSIAGAEQAIALTSHGTIIASCTQDKIFISQKGKEDLVFDTKLVSEAESALTGIVSQY